MSNMSQRSPEETAYRENKGDEKARRYLTGYWGISWSIETTSISVVGRIEVNDIIIHYNRTFHGTRTCTPRKGFYTAVPDDSNYTLGFLLHEGQELRIDLVEMKVQLLISKESFRVIPLKEE